MFQYLFSTRLKTLEDGDGITRRVTLDKQYRMHPLLGGFISRNFYERFDHTERFGSGRPESDFATLCRHERQACRLVGCASTERKTSKDGTSWTRPAEVTVIARQLQAWMSSDAGKDLSFGVISFYKAQADSIRKNSKGSLAGSWAMTSNCVLER